MPRRVYMSTRLHADLLVLFAELDAGLGCVQRVRHLLQRIAQAGHNAHSGYDDSSVALPRTVACHETGTPDKHGGSRFERPLWRTTPICSCVDLRTAWPASRDTGADGDTSRPTTLDAASSIATMLGFGRQELDPHSLKILDGGQGSGRNLTIGDVCGVKRALQRTYTADAREQNTVAKALAYAL